MKNIKLCVFDMAGTTIDENNVVYQVVQAVIAEQGYDVTLAQVLTHGAGKEKYQAIADTLTAETQCTNVQAVAEKAFSRFKPTLDKAYAELAVKPIAGVPEVFAQLRQEGVAVVLNTGYSKAVATNLLEKLDWRVGREIDGLITADDVTRSRPAPDMIVAAMAIAGVTDASQVLKAGDSAIDIQEGQNAHCGMTIGVLSGAQNREQIAVANPTHLLQSLAELPDILSLPTKV